jgi:hypothetical protein
MGFALDEQVNGEVITLRFPLVTHLAATPIKK